MRRFLVVTHGKMAEGMANSIEMVLGKRDDLIVLCAYIDDKTLPELIYPVVESFGEDDEVVVFTDISHGSVNQFFTAYLNDRHYHIITGINLPLVLSIMLYTPNEPLTRDVIEGEIEFAKEQIKYMNTQVVEISEDDELE